MAQNYEIDIKRFNGQDYDTLLPTPASHASTHQADGSDPLTLQAGNYGALSIPTSAYQDASVTRAKLAQDALYSPIKQIAADGNIQADYLGKTLFPKYSASTTTFTLTLDASSSTGLPVGFEVAICKMFPQNKVNIAFSGVRVLQSGMGKIANKDDNITVTITEIGDMVAMKKIDTATIAGDLWLLIGPAEVVS